MKGTGKPFVLGYNGRARNISWGGGNAAFAFVWLTSCVEICGLKGQRFILVPLTWPLFFGDRSRSYS